MTREAFIKKWLGNKNFQYCEEHKELMREDLDIVIDYRWQQVKKCDLADVSVMYCQCDELANINDSLIGIDDCVKCDKPIKRQY